MGCRKNTRNHIRLHDPLKQRDTTHTKITRKPKSAHTYYTQIIFSINTAILDFLELKIFFTVRDDTVCVTGITAKFIHTGA